MKPLVRCEPVGGVPRVRPDAATRCTRATLDALDVPWRGRAPQNGWDMLDAFNATGFRWAHDTDAPGMPLSAFVQGRKGRWYLATPGHALALVDGVLVDTAEVDPNTRLIGAFEILGRR